MATQYAARPLVGMFQELTRKWYAPIVVSAQEATRLADAYVVLMKGLSADTNLKDLYEQLTSTEEIPDAAPQREASSAELAAGMDIMQLVQNVYTEFGFESAFNRANPRNSGWMSVFRKWARSPIFYRLIWPKIESDYHALFRGFVRGLREEIEDAERP